MPETPAATSAAARRAARARAARWLLAADAPESPALAALAWDDLLALPAWAEAPALRLRELAWHAGAWSQAARLQCTIDGRVLTQARMRLGVPAFDALMQAAPTLLETETETETETEPAEPDAFEHEGRDRLLSSIASPALRECVAARLLPNAGPSLRVLPQAEAEAVVAQALRWLEPQAVEVR